MRSAATIYYTGVLFAQCKALEPLNAIHKSLCSGIITTPGTAAQPVASLVSPVSSSASCDGVGYLFVKRIFLERCPFFGGSVASHCIAEFEGALAHLVRLPSKVAGSHARLPRTQSTHNISVRIRSTYARTHDAQQIKTCLLPTELQQIDIAERHSNAQDLKVK